MPRPRINPDHPLDKKEQWQRFILLHPKWTCECCNKTVSMASKAHHIRGKKHLKLKNTFQSTENVESLN